MQDDRVFLRHDMMSSCTLAPCKQPNGTALAPLLPYNLGVFVRLAVFSVFKPYMFSVQRQDYVDVATGSLGQGLSVAAGMAYCGKYYDKARSAVRQLPLLCG